MDAPREFPKTLIGQYHDLYDYLDILKINALKFEGPYKWSKYKTLLFALRVLICPGRGNDLMGRFIRKIGFIPRRKFPGKRGAPSTNPISQPKFLNYDEYINQTVYKNKKAEYTRRQIICELANQDGAHSDEGISELVATGYFVLITGRYVNEKIVLDTAKTIRKYGLQVIEKADETLTLK